MCLEILLTNLCKHNVYKNSRHKWELLFFQEFGLSSTISLKIWTRPQNRLLLIVHYWPNGVWSTESPEQPIHIKKILL